VFIGSSVGSRVSSGSIKTEQSLFVYPEKHSHSRFVVLHTPLFEQLFGHNIGSMVVSFCVECSLVVWPVAVTAKYNVTHNKMKKITGNRITRA
jgi:hypothetical protein